MDRTGSRLAAILLETRNVVVWSTVNRETIFQAKGENWLRIELSPDGHWLAVASVDQIKVWNLEDGRLVLQRARQAAIPPQLAWSPDSGLLLMNEVGAEVRLLASDTWTEVATFPAPALITAPAFSQDGAKLALPGERSGVHVWDLAAVRKRLDELGLNWPDHTNQVSPPKP